MLMEFVVFIPFSTYFSTLKNPFVHPVLEVNHRDREHVPKVGFTEQGLLLVLMTP